MEPNLWTSVQSTITAVQAVLLAIDSALNMIGFGSSSLDGFESTVEDFVAIANEARALIWDINTIEVQIRLLFDLDTAPSNTTELQLRMAEIRRATQEYLTMARRVQTIERSATDAVRRVMNIWGRVMDIAGNKEGSQQVQEALTQLQQQSIQHSAAVTAYQQAMLTKAQAQPLLEESLTRINVEIMADWPRP